MAAKDICYIKSKGIMKTLEQINIEIERAFAEHVNSTTRIGKRLQLKLKKLQIQKNRILTPQNQIRK